MKQKSSLATFVRFSLPALWALAVLWLSLTPSPPQMHGIFGWDKLLHAGAYGLLSLLIAQALLYLHRSIKQAWWQAAVLSILFGALLEILQLSAQTGRRGEWLDLFADAVGAFFCCVIFRHVIKRRCSHEENKDGGHG